MLLGLKSQTKRQIKNDKNMISLSALGTPLLKRCGKHESVVADKNGVKCPTKDN